MKKNLLRTTLLSVAVFGTCCLTSCGVEKGLGTGRYAFLTANNNDICTVETYIQAKFPLNAWGSTNIYAQDSKGGYYVYRFYCDETEYNSLAIGQKVRITGTRSSWSGEIEFGESHDTTIEKLDGNWIAKPIVVNKYVGTAELIEYQNCLVKFEKATVVEYENGKAFKYKGEGDDIYLKIQTENGIVECCVEVDFTNPDSEVYKTVESLKVGDKVDLEGFLNWYNGANPHVSKVTKK